MIGEHGLSDLGTITDIVTQVAQQFNLAFYVEVSPPEYFEKRVFDDKPGVGWMVYVPKVVTVQQVPEARADSCARGRQKANRHDHRERNGQRIFYRQSRAHRDRQSNRDPPR